MSATLKSTLLFCLPLTFFPAIAIAQSPTRTVKVPDATGLRLSLTEPLSSATNEVDDPVRFEVTEDVRVMDVVVVPKGSTAVGHVVEVEPKRRLGRAGKLNFTIDHVKALDGSNLRIRASSTRKGDDKTGTVIVGTVLLSPLFLIMRGKDVSIPKGTAVAAYVDGDRDVQVPGLPGAPPAPVSDTRSGPLQVALQGDNRGAAGQPAGQSTEKATDPSTVVLRSDPDGAEITVDGQFFGNTPSTLQLAAGPHTLSFQKAGFLTWQRDVVVTPGGIVTLKGVLEKREAGNEPELKANRQIPR
ncbi:MAG TPA: PEGA domain-containing protein [Bryobacteraceae bacterium]